MRSDFRGRGVLGRTSIRIWELAKNLPLSIVRINALLLNPSEHLVTFVPISNFSEYHCH